MHGWDLIARFAIVALGVLDLIAALVLWIVARTMVSPKAFLELRRRVDQLEARPGWDDIKASGDALKALGSAVSELKGEVKGELGGLRSSFETLRRSNEIIQEHLLDRDGK